ncbi:hypothetical protein B1756_12230 [Natrarchaeobaculum aegyptiacum]|uniref:SHSP domain-containing protein n=2 Tax=Natrarchaeobaculum aegyptiacum TaxID=745377 RepID=A0A2Z2HWT5_9EURY|nr:hypothetical protein B1756_12230 [Natrarchaeobaculum aegyptiacum]
MGALRDAVADLADDVFFDLLESESAYLYVVDLPGVTDDSVTVEATADRLVIDASREKPDAGEYSYVEEHRPTLVDVDLPLPDDASADGLEVTVDRGILEVVVPREPERYETTIDVAEGRGRRAATDDDAGGDSTTDPDDPTDPDTTDAEPR